ncbi:MAG: cation diffusion facilitator family transporter [Elusimicrobiales bacterium]|nr:cation diffusion facilitator family transporter [Elusimicrobiales bacterium]
MHNSHRYFSIIISKKRFLFVIILNLSIGCLELIFGIISRSLALISDAFHNLEDTISLIISYIAWIYSFKKPTISNTYGYKRAEVIAAFVNSIFLIVISLFISIEGIKRYFFTPQINTHIMIIVSFSAFLVNIFSALIIKKEAYKNLNWKSAYLHMIGDALFSLSVVLGSIAIKELEAFWIDSLLSVIIGIIMMYQGIGIFKKSFNILMQASPDIDYEAIKDDIEKIEGVRNIHHIHCWMNNDDEIFFEAHIEVKDDCMVSQSCLISKQLEGILKNKYKISHTTFQFETDVCHRKELIYSD